MNRTPLITYLKHSIDPARLRVIDKRCVLISSLESILFSVMTAMGIQLDREGTISYGASFAVSLLFLLLISFWFFYTTNRYLVVKHKQPQRAIEIDEGAAWHLPTAIGFLVVCSIIWYLVFFPGVYWYDAPSWLKEWSDPSEVITSKFSIPYTWLFYMFASFGHEHLGSYESGLALFSAVQAILVLYAEIRIVVFLHNRFKHWIACLLPSLFFGLHPLFAILMFSTAQDTPFMAFAGLIGIHLYEMVTEPESYWASKKKIACYAAAILLFCFSRNNGIYAIAFVIPFCFAYKQGLRCKLALVTALPLVVFALYHGPLLNTIGVDTSSAIREMSNIPVQQVARTYNYKYETLSTVEIEEIESLIPKDALETYKAYPSISDALKSNLNVEKLSSDPLASLELYFKLGFDHPGTYTEAALMSNLGLWCPGKQYPDSRIYHPWIECACATPSLYWPDANLVDMHSQSKIQPVYSVITFLFGWDRQHFAQIPVFGTKCRSAVYFWLLVFAIGFVLYSRQYERLVFLAPFIGIVLTILLAPVVIFRYIAPLAFCAPLIIALLFEPPEKSLT